MYHIFRLISKINIKKAGWYGTSRLWVISGGICSPFVTWKRRMSTLKDLHRLGQSFESHGPQQWHIPWQLKCHGVPEVFPIIQKFEEQLWKKKTKHVSKHAKKCKNYQERVAKTIKNHQESLYHGEHTWATVNTHYMVDGHPIHNKDPYNGYYKSLWTIGWLAPINGY